MWTEYAPKALEGEKKEMKSLKFFALLFFVSALVMPMVKR